MFRTICRIAWASLVRRSSRSVLVVVMISMSLWGLLFMEGIYDGMTEQMISNAIRSDSGQLSLFAAGFREDPGLNRLILQDGQITDCLAGDRRVKSFVRRLRQDGLAATAHYSRNVMIYGLDLATEQRHGRLDTYLTQGEYSFGAKKRGAIIGARLAEKLKVKIGRKLIVSAQNSEHEVSAVALTITGIVRTNNMALDESAVFIDMGKARELFMTPEGVTQVSVILQAEKDIPGVQNTLRRDFPTLEILSWDELYPALMQSRVLMKGFNLVMSLLIFGVAGLGIFGVMLVSVLERLREFGIMLAIGTSFDQVRGIIFTESFILGFSGFVGGSLLGGATLLYFYRHGLDLTIFGEGLEEFGMDVITYAVIRAQYFTTAFAAVMLATFVSVLFPLRLLKKANPIEAINKA
ncbi:MAG: FtsX-like permease family protein [Proteobacteria bacterium]|nr:FtsX-like permease family protein [Pseudomonadota bacterium]MBU0965589.1 FtsX-like permease family protein [Pseudomonadota bacterium]